MKFRRELVQNVFIICVLIAAAALVTGIWTKKVHDRDRKAQQDQIPPVFSSISDVEIVSESRGTDQESGLIYVVVRNNSDKGITAIAVKSGTYMVTDDNGLSNDSPDVIIPPHETYTLEIPSSNVAGNPDIEIAGVFYGDGTQAGQQTVLATMQNNRATQLEMRANSSQK